MSTSDIREMFRKRLEGYTSYSIVTDRAAFQGDFMMKLMRDFDKAIAPFMTSKDAIRDFRGIHLTRDQKMMGIHFYAKPVAAAAMLEAFPGYKLVDRDDNEVTLSPASAPKKSGTPKP